MSLYEPPLRSVRFLVNEVLKAPEALAAAGWEDATADLFDAVLGDAGRLAADVLLPLDRSGDEEGARVEGDGVRMPAGCRDAWALWRDGGWNGLAGDPAYGGQGLPGLLDMLVTEMVCAANLAFSITPGLTQGAIRALAAHGDAAVKERCLPPMLAGDWTGAMALTEPQAGTDLGLLRMRAEPVGDGTYRLAGQKMFISSADHDLTDNLVHLVLARLPGAPPGTRGISLFVVPKRLSGGARNGWSVLSVERKMGLHASPTCVVSYDGAVGWLVGAPNRGLAAMFTMMNHERLFVGIQGIGVGERAAQAALAYARERVQGRAAGGGEGAADPILHHPDVRRMVLTARALTDAGRALAGWVALRLDRAAKDPSLAEEAEDWAALLTPVVKAAGTDFGFEAAVLAQQVMGGHGYIRDNGVEQLVRDVRATQIYEGTNGVQALDFVQRKLGLHGGRPLARMLEAVEDAAARLAGSPMTAGLAEPLRDGADRLRGLADWLRQEERDPRDGAAGATDLLRLTALVAYGWMWALTASAAARRPAGYDPGFLDARLGLARFFMTRLLPETAMLEARIRSGYAGLDAGLADGLAGLDG
ncbi:acyl-CoA dehydrogenase C-terminal domain-containing protein [Azospirillum sp. YIM B02556]|uniref:Acyl-CoA dehydrogenase C-terminal domain-containing protein n=1 Tax=Azospirillum endophyticum TaxID=2800326 RepID=A0ABS1F1K4_9PROT|nr:acyl-CoA dehydrogenase C-terminal domain-containing protein [Azospirillum endophyticum]MBK1837310.1 acyl-CoA dehydrogenase C-terminal domain-containing protein [Azospirillum endophyticum]